ncbi:MAG: DNA-binding protein [Clostridia bacterium]|nr:DNA-binding protein [Clostridia bacterium]
MKTWILGLDTSNYKTSAALYCPEYGTWRACGKLLDVPQGTLGLRQSDALFQHVKQLSARVREVCDELDGAIGAVGVSTRPRDLEDSYMPCFLAGQCVGESIAAALGVPVYGFSHQQGHLAAAALSAGRLDLLKQPFYAWHLSGGTTELLRVEPAEDRIIRAWILGGTGDISAGQLIDRLGVRLGMAFPAGPFVEQAALDASGEDWFPVRLDGLTFSFSGVQNQYEARLNKGADAGSVCRFVLLTVGQTILRATRRARGENDFPVLISGGVSVCSLVQELFAKESNVIFAQNGLGGDNAVGTAVLASMRLR